MEEDQNLEALVDRLAAKDRKRRRNALLYLGLPLVAAVILIFWTVQQAGTIEWITSVAGKFVDRSDKQQVALVSLQNQLDRTREATKHIKTGLSNYYVGNYSAAISEYDKAIELDSLNPVVFELKSVSLRKIGEIQTAAEILNKAAVVDSMQTEQRQEFLKIFPTEAGTLSATPLRNLLLELKPDSQDVIKRKLKALELKRR